MHSESNVLTYEHKIVHSV